MSTKSVHDLDFERRMNLIKQSAEQQNAENANWNPSMSLVNAPAEMLMNRQDCHLIKK